MLKKSAVDNARGTQKNVRHFMIGLINAYRQSDDAPAYQLEYGPMMIEFLETAWPASQIKMYEVALGRKPKNIEECRGYIISGSPRGAYEDESWIADLGKFIQACAQEKKKLVGICFGHQVIAHYLGGRAEKSKSGWGVGVREFDVLQNKKWMEPELTKASLIMSHQDQVVKLPDGAELLGRSAFCPNEMYSIGSHMFSVQGHPEFTPKFARSRLETRKELVGKEKYNAGVKTLENHTNSAEFSKWLKAFLT